MRSVVEARGDAVAEERDRDGDVAEERTRDGDEGRMEVGYEGAAGSAALIKLAEDNEPVCRLACLAV